MDNLPPPPPYSLHDPDASSPTESDRQPQTLTTYNAFIPDPALTNVTTPAVIPSQYHCSSTSPTPYRTPLYQNLAPSTTRTQPRFQEVSLEERQKAGFISGAPYFELRTPTQARPRSVFYHHMNIGPDASPDNLPFPQPSDKWSSRGVDDQDWLTFLNHLFPLHAPEKERKRSHELEAHANLKFAGVSGLGLTKVISADQSRPLLEDDRSGPSNRLVNSLPGSSKPEHPEEDLDQELERLRRIRIEVVALQWNEGFFNPRGLEVIADINNRSPLPIPGPSTEPRRGSANVLKKPIPPALEETLLHQAVAKGKGKHVKLLLEKGSEDIEALNRKLETCLFRAVSRGDKDIVQYLLDHGANPMERPPASDSPLHIACYHDRKSIVKLLVESGRVDIEELNGKNETPLYVALLRRNTSCIEVLLNAGANPMARPGGKESMLNVAVTGDLKNIGKLLLQKGVDVEELKGGETPLYRAISRGQCSMVKLLLEHRASANARTLKNEAPLSLAVARGDKTITTLLLNQNSIDIEVENDKHETPLWKSIYQGHTTVAEQLLRKGADPSKSPAGEERTLNLAVGRGNTSLVHLLLERGANFEEKNRSGESPLFQAVSRGDTSIVSLLLGKGANPDTRNPAGETALQRAVIKSTTSIVSLLLGKGANPDLKTVSGDTPLYMAVYRKNTSVVSILLSHGANPEARSLNGELPLNRAIYIGSTSIVSLLLARGADPGAKSVHGETMMDYALKRGDKTIIQLMNNCSPPRMMGQVE